MNLIVDIGNTAIKIAVANGENIEEPRSVTSWNDGIEQWLECYSIDAAIISSVSDEPEAMLQWIDAHCPRVIHLSHTTPLPFSITYDTPNTLGLDRIAAVAGAQTLAPNNSTLLVIDAGTAITYEVIVANQYLGGNISPGVQMRLRALHQLTARLPLVTAEGDTPNIGYNTETAIRAGVVGGIVHEIEGYINEIKKKYPDVLIFLTGGDVFLLASQLKNRIFADKFIVIKGLNRILNHNVNS